MPAPLGGEGDAAAFAGIEVVVTIIEDMREGEAVRGTEIIIDSTTPSFFHFILAIITFLLIILKAVSCFAAPI